MKVAIIAVSLLFIMVGYQNCGKQMKFQNVSSEGLLNSPVDDDGILVSIPAEQVEMPPAGSDIADGGDIGDGGMIGGIDDGSGGSETPPGQPGEGSGDDSGPIADEDDEGATPGEDDVIVIVPPINEVPESGGDNEGGDPVVVTPIPDEGGGSDPVVVVNPPSNEDGVVPVPGKNSGKDKSASGLNYVCVLKGNGKSNLLSFKDRLLGENSTPNTVCTTERACLEIASETFEVVQAVKRGYCKNNPHVVRLSEDALSSLLSPK